MVLPSDVLCGNILCAFRVPYKPGVVSQASGSKRGRRIETVRALHLVGPLGHNTIWL